MPEADGFEAIHTVDRGVAVQAQPAFDGLQPPLVAQRGQDKPQIDMRLVKPGLGEVSAQEGHVELAAVEADQERELAM